MVKQSFHIAVKFSQPQLSRSIPGGQILSITRLRSRRLAVGGWEKLNWSIAEIQLKLNLLQGFHYLFPFWESPSSFPRRTSTPWRFDDLVRRHFFLSASEQMQLSCVHRLGEDGRQWLVLQQSVLLQRVESCEKVAFFNPSISLLFTIRFLPSESAAAFQFQIGTVHWRLRIEHQRISLCSWRWWKLAEKLCGGESFVRLNWMALELDSEEILLRFDC